MAGEQKRKARAALVTKALLLGYTFAEQPAGYVLCIAPEGSEGWFKNYAEAARAALRHSGVPDATKS